MSRVQVKDEQGSVLGMSWVQGRDEKGSGQEEQGLGQI